MKKDKSLKSETLLEKDTKSKKEIDKKRDEKSEKAIKKEKRKKAKHKDEEMMVEAPKLYGNENFGIPKDCSKKQKFSSIKLFFYILTVGVVCVLGYTGYRTATDYFLPEMSFDKGAQPLLYTKNKDLMLKSKDRTKGSPVSAGGTLYDSRDAGKYTGLTKDGSGIFYASWNEENRQGFDLYFRKTSTVGEDKEASDGAILIDHEVNAFKIQPEGKFVVYTKDDDLYLSDMNEVVFIAPGVDAFYLSDNHQQVIYKKDDTKLYTFSTDKKSKPKMVDYDITKVLTETNEYAKVYYLKHNALWQKEYDKEPVCMAENVIDGIQLGDIVYYVLEEARPQRYYDVFLDDTSDSDRIMQPPEAKNFVTEDENGTLILEQEAYDAAKAMYAQKLFRDEIRSFYRDEPVKRTELVLYEAKDNGIREVDCGLLSANLQYFGCKETIVYKKLLDHEEKVRLSDVTDKETAQELVSDWLAQERPIGVQVLVKDKAPFRGMEEWPNGKFEISLDGKYIYCIENVGDDGRGVLVRYEIVQRSLKNRIELVPQATDFAVDGSVSDVVMVFDGDKLGICVGDKYTHLSDASCHEFFYVDRTLFYFDEYDRETQTGDLMRFHDGKMKRIDYGVREFNVRNMQTVVYLKEYNPAVGYGNLYYQEGNKEEVQIDFGVGNILY